MSFFAVLFALLIEQLKPLPRGNVIHDSLTGWMRWTGRNFDAGRDHHAWVVWIITAILVLGGTQFNGLRGEVILHRARRPLRSQLPVPVANAASLASKALTNAFSTPSCVG